MELIKPIELVSDAPAWIGPWGGETIWRFLNAARDGDHDTVAAMLAREPTLVRAEYWYTPALHFAARDGHLRCVELLVDAGADLTHRSLHGGETLLQMAEDRGRADVAEYLRRLLAERDAKPGQPEIHRAVAREDIDAVATLVAGDPSSVNRGDGLGRRPLHVAVDTGSQELAELLLNHGANVDAAGFSVEERLGGDGFRPATLALWRSPYWQQRNDYDMVRLLLANGARYSICVAAALGDEDRVRQLLAKDPSVANEAETCGKRPLSAAAERGYGAIVDLLLDAGADPTLADGPMCPGGHALWAAARFGHADIAERLLRAGADPNAYMESSGTPTGSAGSQAMRNLLYRYGGRVGIDQHVHDGNIDTVAALLDAKPDLFDEMRTIEAFTLAVSAGHEDIVRLLLARGLRVPKVVTYCQSYLWRSLDLARLLLEHGMDPSLPNWQRVTPLHYLAASGNVAGAKLFLEYGADAGAVDEEYRTTPLGWAARKGQADFVKFALDAGWSSHVPEVPGWAQPSAWARQRGHDDIVALLAA